MFFIMRCDSELFSAASCQLTSAVQPILPCTCVLYFTLILNYFLFFSSNLNIWWTTWSLSTPCASFGKQGERQRAESKSAVGMRSWLGKFKETVLEQHEIEGDTYRGMNRTGGLTLMRREHHLNQTRLNSLGTSPLLPEAKVNPKAKLHEAARLRHHDLHHGHHLSC